MKNLTIDVQDLHINFGKYPALCGLDLQVERGSAMALLGENGAGKTTTLRLLTGIYQSSRGSGSVLGKPLCTESSELFQQIGYVSENQELPSHWTVTQLLNYLRPLYPTWDQVFCDELVENFELPLDRKLGHLSRGMFMKAALVSSMAYRPTLLILDEPFSGLDPLVREELIDGVLDLMDGGDWTILLSSHDVHEVERLCDSVTLIENGKSVLSESLDQIQSRYRRWSITTETTQDIENFPSDWLLVDQISDNQWSLVETKHDPACSLEQLQQVFGPLMAQDSQTLSLREIYLIMAQVQKRQRVASRKQSKSIKSAPLT